MKFCARRFVPSRLALWEALLLLGSGGSWLNIEKVNCSQMKVNTRLGDLGLHQL